MYPVSSLHFTSLHLQTKSLICIPSVHSTSLHFTSLQTKSLHINPVSSLHITTLYITSLHFKQNHFTCIPSVHSTSDHFTSRHFTYLHPIPTLNSPACNYILNPFLNVYSLQQKDANKPTCNWFQLLMVLFTKGYLPTSVLCFLVLIFRL